MFDKIDRYLELFSTTVMVLTMTVATLVAFVNVVLRYLFNASLTWAGELTSYLFIWSALFGAAYGFKIGMHLGVTVVIQKLPPKVAKWVLSFSLLIIFGYLVCLIVWGYDFVMFNHMLEMVSVDLQISYWIIYICVPIAMFIAAYQVLLKLIKTLQVPADEFSYDMVMKEHS
ncbi:MAG: TRAP transporter small permease [Desulfuromonadaceae bacterium]|nr:TRAP transporter small permease [Desulfuromonadaceae bacterium]